MKLCVLTIIMLLTLLASAQTGVGIGIYPTGTETGLGLRTAKNARWIADVRIAKAVFFNAKNQSSFITEASAVCKLIQLEKVRLHLGIGARAEWNFGDKKNKYGAIIPLGIEAFPFPFQNAGLFFEAAPFFTHDFENGYYGGLRTVAGFIFYFPVKERKEEIKN